MAEIPKWQQIVTSETWQNITPEKQEEVRQRWMKNVAQKNPNWGQEQLAELDQKTQQVQQSPPQIKPPHPGATPQGNARQKGPGFLGTLQRPDGGVSTELSVEEDGIEFPTLVPTLTQQEQQHLLQGNPPTEQIMAKARGHAKERMAQGLSPFAEAPTTDKESLGYKAGQLAGKGVRKAGEIQLGIGQKIAEGVKSVGSGLVDAVSQTDFDPRMVMPPSTMGSEGMGKVTLEGLMRMNIPLSYVAGGLEGGINKKEEDRLSKYLTNPLLKAGYIVAKNFDNKAGLKAAEENLLTGKIKDASSIQKALTGKSFEEQYGIVMGSIINIAASSAIDPLIIAPILTNIVKGARFWKQTINAIHKNLDKVKALPPSAMEKVKALTGYIEQKALGPAKSTPAKGRVGAQKELGEGTKAIAPGQPPKKLKKGQAIEAPSAEGPTGPTYLEGKEVPSAIPARAASEGAVHKAVREGAVTEGRIVRKKLTEAPGHPRKALPSAEKKAIKPPKKAKGELKGTKPIPLRGAKIPLSAKALTTKERAYKKATESAGAIYKGVKDGNVAVHSPFTGSTNIIPVNKFNKKKVADWISTEQDKYLKALNDQTLKGTGARAVDMFDEGKVILKNTKTGDVKKFDYYDVDRESVAKWLQTSPKPVAPAIRKKPWDMTVPELDRELSRLANIAKGKASPEFNVAKAVQQLKKGREVPDKFMKQLEDAIPAHQLKKLLKEHQPVKPKSLPPKPKKTVEQPKPTQEFTVSGEEIVPASKVKLSDHEIIDQYLKTTGATKIPYRGEVTTVGKTKFKEVPLRQQVGGNQLIKRQTERDLKAAGILGEADSINKSPNVLPLKPDDPLNSGGGGTILPSLGGGLQTFFENRAATKLTSEGLGKWKKPYFSVTAPWKDLGFEKTGIAIKNIYSMSEEIAERGIQWMQRLSKIGKTGKWTALGKKGYSKDDLSEIALLAGNKKRWASLPAKEKERLGEGVKLMQDFFKDAQKRYRELGANVDFKRNMQDIYEDQIGALKKLVDEMKDVPIQQYERAIFKDLGLDIKGLPKVLSRKQAAQFMRKNLDENAEILKRLDNMEFVHIPYDMWFQQGKITNAGATLKALKIANAQKRKTIIIEDLIEAGAIKKGDVNAFDILASYTHRMSKDIAMLRLKQIARREGLLSKDKIPGFRKLPAFQAPMFSDVSMHPAFADWMMDFKFQTFNVNAIDKAFSTVKMWQFAKPLFLPYYDAWQGAVARAFSNPLHLARDVKDAAKMMITKNEDYYKFMGEGLSSRPIDVPWNQFEDMLLRMKGTNFGDFMVNSMKNKNWTLLKPIYNALWETAWLGDRFIRLTTANYFNKTLKMSKGDAAQLGALFHSDYANVPIATRRTMNKLFFTPTFKITMFKLYKEMTKALVSAPIKMAAGKTVTQAEKQLAKGGLATLGGAMIGFDQLMTRGFGYERDQFARRYYKRVEDPEMPGELRDHVVVFSNPLTMIPKYMYKGNKIIEGMSHDKKMETIINTMKWEIHPVYRIAYDLAQNKRANGEPIVVPFEYPEKVEPFIKAGYALKESLKVLEQIPAFKEKESKEAWNAWKKDVGNIMSLATAPATFAYYRRPQLNAQVYKIDRMVRDLSKALQMKDRKGELSVEKEIQMTKEFEKRINREIEKLDKMVAEYDKDVMKSMQPKPPKREQIKKPTPYISVPGYTPPPDA